MCIFRKTQFVFQLSSLDLCICEFISFVVVFLFMASLKHCAFNNLMVHVIKLYFKVSLAFGRLRRSVNRSLWASSGFWLPKKCLVESIKDAMWIIKCTNLIKLVASHTLISADKGRRFKMNIKKFRLY